MATWRKLIELRLKENGESFNDIIKITLTEEQLDKRFDDDFGYQEGEPFTAWTKEYVYFPVVYDGSEWVSSVPRNPCDTVTEYIEE